METTNPVLVAVDPGHGGNDPGAVWNGRVEKDDNLRLGLALQNALRAQGVEVVLTREDDRNIPAPDRLRAADEMGADLLLSLHRAAAEMPGLNSNGVGCYVYLTAPDITSGRVARYLLDQVVRTGAQSDHGVRRGNQYLLRRAAMPAVLLEMGYLTDEGDNRLFDQHLPAYAEAITRGILEYFGLEYRPIQSPAWQPTPLPQPEFPSENMPTWPDPIPTPPPWQAPPIGPIPPVGPVPPGISPLPPAGARMPDVTPLSAVPIPSSIQSFSEVRSPPSLAGPPTQAAPSITAPSPIPKEHLPEAEPPPTPATPEKRPAKSSKPKKLPPEELVTRAQQALNKEFHTAVPVDGKPGEKTKSAAVRELQTLLGKGVRLVADGILGPKTAALLPILRLGGRGGLTTLLQILLGLKGHDPGKIDGEYGPRTREAVEEFQRERYLIPDGVAGPRTLEHLLK